MPAAVAKRLASLACPGALCLALGICAAGSAADPLYGGKVADAADYMSAASASHVEDVVKSACMPFERSPDNLPDGGMVYPDRRGFTNTGQSSLPDAWVRPLSIGGFEAQSQTDGSAISLRVRDSFGNASRVAIAQVGGAAQHGRPAAEQSAGSGDDARRSSFWNDPQIVSLVERVQRMTSSASGSSNIDASAVPPGFHMGFVPLRPGHSNAVEAGVVRVQSGSASRLGLSLSGEFIPLVTDGINRNVDLRWGASSARTRGGVRFSGGRIAGSAFRLITVSQNIPFLPHARSSMAWSSFTAGGRTYGEAILTSAFAAGPHSEFGIGFALQQSGSSPFVSYARPLGKSGQLSLAVGAPSSIATRAPFTIQLACPL